MSALCGTLLRAGKRATKPHTLSIVPYRAFHLRRVISKLFGHLDIWDVIDILHFPHHRHKADAAALGLSCGVCFEALACVFASAGASLKKTDDTLTKNIAFLYQDVTQEF